MADYLEDYRKKKSIDRVRPILANVLYGLGLEDKIKDFLTGVSSEKTAFGGESPVSKAMKYVGGAIGNMLMPEEIDPLATATYGGMKAKGYKPNEPMGQFSNLKDQKVRFEIDDSGARLHSARMQMTPKQQVTYKATGETSFKLGDLYEHPKLYEQYPELANIKVYYDPKESGARYVPPDVNTKYANSIVTGSIDNQFIGHEIQHIIQQKEGFAKGSNPSNYSNIDTESGALLALRNKLSNKPLTPYEAYMNTAGEIEARDVVNRLYFSPEQRMGTGVYTSENIPIDDWIVK